MSEFSATTGPADGAVRLDMSNADTAAESLREAGALGGKIVFYRKGSDYFAVQQSKGPSFLESITPVCFDPQRRHSANDEVGARLARLFPGGPGASLQKQMNSGWIKQAVESSELVSGFQATLHKDIGSRVNALRDTLYNRRFPSGGEDTDRITNDAFVGGFLDASRVLSMHRAREITYGEATWRLRVIRDRCLTEHRELHPENLTTKEVKEVQQAKLLSKIRLKDTYDTQTRRKVSLGLRNRHRQVYAPSRDLLDTARVVNRCRDGIAELRRRSADPDLRKAVDHLERRLNGTQTTDVTQAVDEEVQALLRRTEATGPPID